MHIKYFELDAQCTPSKKTTKYFTYDSKSWSNTLWMELGKMFWYKWLFFELIAFVLHLSFFAPFSFAFFLINIVPKINIVISYFQMYKIIATYNHTYISDKYLPIKSFNTFCILYCYTSNVIFAAKRNDSKWCVHETTDELEMLLVWSVYNDWLFIQYPYFRCDTSTTN